jgi:hypothetical protein
MGVFVGKLEQTMTVHVLGNLAYLPLYLNIGVAGYLYVVGQETVICTGTVTSYTPVVRTYGAAARARIGSTGTSGLVPGQHMRITGGNANARLNARSIVDADLGSGNIRCTAWILPDAAPHYNAPFPTAVSPAAGDTFEVYTVPLITNGPVMLRPTQLPVQYKEGQWYSCVGCFENVALGDATAWGSCFFTQIGESIWLAYLSVTFNAIELYGLPHCAISCEHGTSIRIGSGNSLESFGGRTSGEISLLSAAMWIGDYDHYVEGQVDCILSSAEAALTCGLVGVFCATGDGLVITSGNRLHCRTYTAGSHQLYGTCSGAGTFGITLEAASALTYATNPPAIAGGAGGGDFRVAGNTTLCPWDSANHVHRAAVALSWANLVAALPTGFAHHLMDPGSGAIVSRESS